MHANVLVKTKDMPRDEWLEWRKRGIGSSDIASIVGLTPRYRTQIDVWLDRTGQEPIDTRPPFVIDGEEYPSEAAYFGLLMENTVASHYAAVTGHKIFRSNAILQHPQYPFMLANLDREVLIPGKGRGVLEIKTASAFLADEWKDEKVPLAYQAQVQWQIAITGYEYGVIAALVGGNHFVYTTIERDEEVIASLIDAAAAFWQHVTDRTMPPVDGSEKCADSLADLYPDSREGAEIELPPTIKASELETYFLLKDKAKQIDEDLTLIENRIKAEMGDSVKAYRGDYEAKWLTVTSARLDTKRLKAEQPDIYKQYAAESKSRRFTLKRGA